MDRWLKFIQKIVSIYSDQKEFKHLFISKLLEISLRHLNSEFNLIIEKVADFEWFLIFNFQSFKLEYFKDKITLLKLSFYKYYVLLILHYFCSLVIITLLFKCKTTDIVKLIIRCFLLHKIQKLDILVIDKNRNKEFKINK